jgi:hypothetical protein
MTTQSPSEIATRAAVSAEAPPDELIVVVVSGQARGQRTRLGERLRIGKAPDNDLVLPDDTVSRHHCELERATSGIVVRDLGSTNHTPNASHPPTRSSCSKAKPARAKTSSRARSTRRARARISRSSSWIAARSATT